MKNNLSCGMLLMFGHSAHLGQFRGTLECCDGGNSQGVPNARLAVFCYRTDPVQHSLTHYLRRVIKHDTRDEKRDMKIKYSFFGLFCAMNQLTGCNSKHLCLSYKTADSLPFLLSWVYSLPLTFDLCHY